jgi:hypothetical protein
LADLQPSHPDEFQWKVISLDDVPESNLRPYFDVCCCVALNRCIFWQSHLPWVHEAIAAGGTVLIHWYGPSPIENSSAGLQCCWYFSERHGMSSKIQEAQGLTRLQMTIAYVMRYQQLPLAEAYALCEFRANHLQAKASASGAGDYLSEPGLHAPATGWSLSYLFSLFNTAS